MMKKTFSILVIAAALLVTLPASAQIKFGIRGGANLVNMKFNNGTFDKDNRAGFVGGAMIEFTVPSIGIGLDASVLYVHREAKSVVANQPNLTRDYLDIPVNLKYKLCIPVISNVLKPFVTTGPSFAFLTSKKEIEAAFKNKSVDIAWNFGFGVELLSHVQVAASYGLGLTNTLEKIGTVDNKATIEGKNRYWTVTAAYLF